MSPSTPIVLWDLAGWARAVADLPAPGPLPARTAIVPSERHAHALRRECLRAGRADALAGTLFATPAALALDVLREAETFVKLGEEALRPARLRAILEGELDLAAFPRDLLRSTRGWDEAFARTIGDLEGAGLRPDDLARRADAPAFADVARVWRAADEAAGPSWTRARAIAEAAAVLERDPARWPHPGPALAALSGHETAAEARLARAIPGSRIALLAARPLRERHLRRVEALLGAPAADALRAASAPGAAATERDLLASYLLEPDAVANDPARPRSRGPDGTVHLEQHAGVEAELEATADWVARQILERATPLEEIAVLVPARDPLAALVAERIARLPAGAGREVAVHVAGGLPLPGTASGARALAIVRALRAHLAIEDLGDVLPTLRPQGDEARRLSRGAALDLASALGTAGGSAVRPEGALEWARRAREREPDLAALVARAEASPEDDESAAAAARDARSAGRLLADLRAVRPALEELVALARLALEGAPLADLWPALRGFLEAHVLLPGAGALARIVAAVEDLVADARCATATRDAALALVEQALLAARVSPPRGRGDHEPTRGTASWGETVRFGDPAVYVGTIAGAAGLAFGAVRVIGLAEGSVPGVPREDPVLPDALRERLGAALPIAADRALREVHALERAIRGATREVVLSAPVLGIERSERAPAAIFLEAMAALGRPERRLDLGAFAPAREAARRFRRERPLGEAARQDAVARAGEGLPASWLGAPELDLARIHALETATALGPLDGVLGRDTPVPPLAGTSPERPISASGLHTLLQCPHRFLLERVLGWSEPAKAASPRELDPRAYGSLFHRLAEAFARRHGEGFAARRETLDAWRERARVLAREVFAALLREAPLTGETVRAQQLARLEREFGRFLEHDWSGGRPRAIAGVEKPFGHPLPVVLDFKPPLHVRGFIDRIDVEGKRALVRDLKTGRAYPRTGDDAGPSPVLDVQIALYGIVARERAKAWGLPSRIGASYVYTRAGREGERAFVDDDFAELEAAARSWLAGAARLLAERSFPRTTDAHDCAYCAFRPVCGDGAAARSAALLEGEGGALGAFREIRS